MRWPVGKAGIGFWALCAAILVYALSGSPAPESFGWSQFLTGLLLVVAAGAGGVMQIVRVPRAGDPLWIRAGWALCLYGLSVPLLSGIALGHVGAHILRDVIPFLFMMMPFLLWPLLTARRKDAEVLSLLVALSGFIFAARLLWRDHGGLLPVADPMFLANAPTVLYAAILFFALAGYVLVRPGGAGRYGLAALFIVLATVPVLAMAAITQRATIGVLALSLIIMLGIGFWRYDWRRVGVVALCGMGLILCFKAPLALHLESLFLKTSVVGLNNRVEEFAAVLSGQDHLGAILFGQGWGQTLHSPAVGGAQVNFTHNLFSALWLKTGFAGVMLAMLYLLGLAQLGFKILWARPHIALAIAGPVAICCVLYASYKSLDFGMVLMLLPLWAARLAPPGDKVA